MKRARICILLALTLVFVLGFGSTALAETQCEPSPPSPSFRLVPHRGPCCWSKVYGWTINKFAEPINMTLSKGDSQAVQYTIVLDKDDGTVILNIKAQLNIFVSDGPLSLEYVKGKVTKDGDPIDGTEKSIGLPNSGELGNGKTSLNYEATFPSLGSGVYRVAFEVKADDGTVKTAETHRYTFDGPMPKINEEVDVSDIQTSNLPAGISFTNQTNYQSHWHAEGDKTVTYQVTITNDTRKKGGFSTFNNTVSIDGTEISDSISVKVKVPGASKPPEPREERKVRWPDRTPPPGELESASVELPKTGGLIEWEWLALAGGMLASGGGALYLVRRRKMKK